MGSVFGDNIKISVWGQSHSEAIGVTIDGLRAGERIDRQRLQAFCDRRAPGQDAYSTTRKEADVVEIPCGIVDDVTCGAPLTCLIKNTNTRSKDYENLREVPRPGHGDYAVGKRFAGFQDVAGGGHTSGRLTAPICAAGGIAIQILERAGIYVRAYIQEIAGIKADSEDWLTQEPTREWNRGEFPCYSEDAARRMKSAIEDAKLEGNSVGGIIECKIVGVPAGIGNPMFDGVENKLAAMLFGIPAVKGVEFGNGMQAARLRGSDNNDEYLVKDGKIQTKTNNHGGILGGVTSGMPIVFRVGIKPTPSIAKPQQSVRLTTMKEETLSILGRHDPCIVPRAVPVVEAVAAFVILDFLYGC